MEEPGMLQSMGSQRVRQNLETEQQNPLKKLNSPFDFSPSCLASSDSGAEKNVVP